MKISNPLKGMKIPKLPDMILPSGLIKKGVQVFLHNRGVLYLLFAFSIFSIIFFLNKNKWVPIVVFMLTAFLISFFYKNMIVVFGFSLFISYLIYFQSKSPFEGLEGMEDEEKDKDEEKEKDKDKDEPKEKDETEQKESMTSDKEDKPTKKNTVKESDETDVGTNQQKKDYDELKGDYEEFQSIQKKIMDGVKEINPLLDKADKFIDKMETFKTKYG